MLPGQDKRERDLTQKLAKPPAQAGWHRFVSAQAHAIATGKAPARRNAQIMVVQELTRWRSWSVPGAALDTMPAHFGTARRAIWPPAPSAIHLNTAAFYLEPLTEVPSTQ